MRFTIRQMMAWTVGIGVILGVLFGFPDFVSLPLMALFVMSLPVTLIVGTIYARNWKRTFFIGALIATSPILTFIMFYGPMMLMGVSVQMDFDWSDIDEATLMVKIYGVGLAVFGALNGAIALGVRWLVSESSQPAQASIQQSKPTMESPVVSRLEPLPVPYAVMEGRVTVEST
jgi:hypothetical protein